MHKQCFVLVLVLLSVQDIHGTRTPDRSNSQDFDWVVDKYNLMCSPSRGKVEERINLPKEDITRLQISALQKKSRENSKQVVALKERQQKTAQLVKQLAAALASEGSSSSSAPSSPASRLVAEELLQLYSEGSASDEELSEECIQGNQPQANLAVAGPSSGNIQHVVDLQDGSPCYYKVSMIGNRSPLPHLDLVPHPYGWEFP